MDANECSTVIEAGRGGAGKSYEELLADMDNASREFAKAARHKFGGTG